MQTIISHNYIIEFKYRLLIQNAFNMCDTAFTEAVLAQLISSYLNPILLRGGYYFVAINPEWMKIMTHHFMTFPKNYLGSYQRKIIFHTTHMTIYDVIIKGYSKMKNMIFILYQDCTKLFDEKCFGLSMGSNFIIFASHLAKQVTYVVVEYLIGELWPRSYSPCVAET